VVLKRVALEKVPCGLCGSLDLNTTWASSGFSLHFLSNLLC